MLPLLPRCPRCSDGLMYRDFITVGLLLNRLKIRDKAMVC